MIVTKLQLTPKSRAITRLPWIDSGTSFAMIRCARPYIFILFFSVLDIITVISTHLCNRSFTHAGIICTLLTRILHPLHIRTTYPASPINTGLFFVLRDSLHSYPSDKMLKLVFLRYPVKNHTLYAYISLYILINMHSMFTFDCASNLLVATNNRIFRDAMWAKKVRLHYAGLLLPHAWFLPSLPFSAIAVKSIPYPRVENKSANAHWIYVSWSFLQIAPMVFLLAVAD